MSSKAERSVFLYMDPASRRADEQCGTCFFWITDDRCYIHRPKDKITASMSCCYYLYGAPMRGRAVIRPHSLTTPEQSGLVDREVRCENCKWGGPGVHQCGLFTLLNKKLPDVFDLDTAIDTKGCCNAQEPRPASAEREKRLVGQEI
jgi:hypothetical protein